MAFKSLKLFWTKIQGFIFKYKCGFRILRKFKIQGKGLFVFLNLKVGSEAIKNHT